MNKIKTVKLISLSSISIPLFSGIGLITTGCSDNKEAYADIVAANDMHGAIDQSTHKTDNPNRAPAIDCLFNEYLKITNEDNRKTGKDNSTHFLLNGDVVQGSNMTVFSEQPGDWIWRVVNKLPYFYSSIGNHESDWGLDYMAEQFSYMGHVKWLCANLYNKESKTLGTEYLTIQPYTIVKVNDLNVGLVGYTSVDINKSSGGVLGDYEAIDAGDNTSPVYLSGETTTGDKVLQNAINACWNNTDENILNGEKPDTVLLLAHAGAYKDDKGNPDPENPEYSKDSEIFKVVHNIKGVDGVLSSHSHKSYLLKVSDKDNKKIPVGQADWHCESLLQTKIHYDKKNKKNIKVDMSLHDTHTEKSYDDLEYKNSEWFQLVDNNYAYFNGKVQTVNSSEALKVKANSKAEATIEKSKNINGFGEVPVLGNILCKTLVKALTKEAIDTEPYAETVIPDSWTGFSGIDFYIDNDDTTVSGISPSKWTDDTKTGYYTYGDITQPWKYQQQIFILKIKAKHLQEYYTVKNCNKKPQENSFNIIDPIYSSKYKLKFDGSTVATSTKVKIVFGDDKTHEVGDDTDIYVGMSSFMRDNRGRDWFYQYATPENCVAVNANWTFKHPATEIETTINGYGGDAFGFIYAARQIGGYASDPTKPMIDLSDTTSMYKFDVTDHFVKA